MNRRRKIAFASMVLLGTLNLQLDLVAVGTGVQENTGFERRFRFHRSSTFDHAIRLFAQILSEQSLKYQTSSPRQAKFPTSDADQTAPSSGASSPTSLSSPA